MVPYSNIPIIPSYTSRIPQDDAGTYSGPYGKPEDLPQACGEDEVAQIESREDDTGPLGGAGGFIQVPKR